jgi:hypothetical protein
LITIAYLQCVFPDTALIVSRATIRHEERMRAQVLRNLPGLINHNMLPPPFRFNDTNCTAARKPSTWTLQMHAIYESHDACDGKALGANI